MKQNVLTDGKDKDKDEEGKADADADEEESEEKPFKLLEVKKCEVIKTFDSAARSRIFVV